MVGLADVRDWLRGLGAVDATWTIGRFEAEKEKRACVYQRPDYSEQQAAIGGREATKTVCKRVQVLLHWNRNHRETEEAAMALYDALRFNPRGTVGGAAIGYVSLEMPEPADLGSDEHGIFERSIWADIYYEEA